MPVAFVFESDQVDQPGYDALMKAIGRESIDAPNPPGHIVTWPGPGPVADGGPSTYGSPKRRPAPFTARTSSRR
jgi:hypothetical protein